MFPFFSFTVFSHHILIPLYGLCIVTGLFAASFLGVWLSKKTGQNYLDFVIVLTCSAFIGFVGAKLMYVIISCPPSMYFREFMNMGGGYVFYGGLITGPLGVLLGVKISKTKMLDFLNIFVCCLPLVHAFGRLGCFFAGCCYGIPYDGLFAVHYSKPITNVQPDIGIFPVQLLESVLNLILFALLFIYAVKHLSALRKNIDCVFIYLFCYSVMRFFLENLRGDLHRGIAAGLSTSQIVSIVLFFATGVLFAVSIFIRRRKTACL